MDPRARERERASQRSPYAADVRFHPRPRRRQRLRCRPVPYLPEFPKVELVALRDRSSDPDGFLVLKRWELLIQREGEKSAPFQYDMVERRALDAAVMAAHFVGSDQKPWVYLRSALRPPVALDARYCGTLWELPAGLIEPGEEPRAAAARELEEELGFVVPPAAMDPLGPRCYPAPGVIGEVQYFFHVRVDPSARRPPSGDGSPLEDCAQIVSLPLDDALAACRDGEVLDGKTELALRRLRELL